MSTQDFPAQIGDLPPIGRPANAALMSIGVTTLAEIARMSKRELLDLHGVGPKAIRLLEQALAEHSLSFPDADR